MNRIFFTAMVTVAPALSLGAQQQPAPVSLVEIGRDVYVATGGAGSNSGIVVGPTGVILVDTKTTVDSEKDVLAAIAKVTPKPVIAVFLTHSDGDHVNGVAALPKGIQVIAHENCKKEMESAITSGGRGAPVAESLPNRVTTKEREDFVLDGVRFSGFHWGPAHTSGDLVVLMPDLQIAFGDILATNRPDPIIHNEKNGSSEGWIGTVEKITELDATQFVPGHGDIQTKSDIQKRLAAVREKRARIVTMVGQGKSLDEIKQALGEPAVAVPAGGRGGGLPAFTDVVYRELTHR